MCYSSVQWNPEHLSQWLADRHSLMFIMEVTRTIVIILHVQSLFSAIWRPAMFFLCPLCGENKQWMYVPGTTGFSDEKWGQAWYLPWKGSELEQTPGMVCISRAITSNCPQCSERARDERVGFTVGEEARSKLSQRSYGCRYGTTEKWGRKIQGRVHARHRDSLGRWCLDGDYKEISLGRQGSHSADIPKRCQRARWISKQGNLEQEIRRRISFLRPK